MGKYEEAKKAIDKALELDPDNADAENSKELIKIALGHDK